MPIEGLLRELAMPDIFQLLHLSRKTGELMVEGFTGERGSVFFDTGAVVGGRLEGAAPRLGRLLLNAGKITESTLRRAEEIRRAEPDRPWDEIFVSIGNVTREEIEKFVRFQIEELVYEILEWGEGRFSFTEKSVPQSESVTWIPTESLLMEGARRADERSALPIGIDGTGAVPRLGGSDDGGTLDLSPLEWEVLGRVDGNSDVRSIAWDLGRTELEVSKVIAGLLQKGLVEMAPPRPERSRSPEENALDRAEAMVAAGELESARQLVLETLARHPSEPKAHFLLGRLEARRGSLRDAASRFEKTLEIDPLAPEPRLHLGLVRLRLGDLSGAVREWTAYLRVAPDGPVRRRVERAMAAAHELDSAVQEFDGRQPA